MLSFNGHFKTLYLMTETSYLKIRLIEVPNSGPVTKTVNTFNGHSTQSICNSLIQKSIVEKYALKRKHCSECRKMSCIRRSFLCVLQITLFCCIILWGYAQGLQQDLCKLFFSFRDFFVFSSLDFHMIFALGFLAFFTVLLLNLQLQQHTVTLGNSISS